MTDTDGLQEELFAAIEGGNVEGVRALVAAHPEAAAARRDDGVSTVLWARYQYQLEALDALLAANPPLDVFEAAAVGRTDAIRDALAADPDLATAYAPDGFTALGLAAFFGHPGAAKLLIEAGARINDASRNPMHVAPLHSALAGRHAEIVDMLLAAGADVNAVQADGYTPLHEAAQNGDQAMAERLVAAGANRDVRLDNGATPADSARAAGHEALAAWLESR